MRQRASSLFFVVLLLGCNAGAAPNAPETVAVTPPTSESAPPQPAPTASAVAAPDVSAGAVHETPREAEAPDAEKKPAAVQEPPLLAPDGSALPQTDERPSTSSDVFTHHVNLLFEAIIKDDPQIARPFFFPDIAYEQVKAIANPKRDWQTRLWRLFERDVHAYHRQLGDRPLEAKLDRLEVREQAVKWMKPHSEGNNLGYYRVTRNRLHFTAADGRKRHVEVTSLISWRGHWYVVHLNGFQ